jgi:hypothetical protein
MMRVLCLVALCQVTSSFRNNLRPAASIVRLSAKSAFAPVETLKMSDKKEKAPEKEGWERIQGLIEVQICIYMDR